MSDEFSDVNKNLGPTVALNGTREGQTMTLYEENQSFAFWVYLLCALSLGGGGVGLAASAQEMPVNLALPLVGFAVFTLFLLNILHLRTRVDHNEVHVQLGYFVPCFWASIPIENITLAQPVTYRPIRDAGGWGLRWGRFDGKSCTFWNARGNQGVHLQTAKRNYLIGSQTPEDLCRAILRAKGC